LVCINKTRGDGVLTAILAKLGSCSHRYDLEFCFECVCVEIHIFDGINLLVGNHYFSPDTKPEVITDYFAIVKTLWTLTILTLFYRETSMLLVLTGRAGHQYLNATIILNSKGMLYTVLHVFLA
jgi:hypothetical protein